MLTIDFQRLDVKPAERVLDLGCGRGRHVHALYAQKQVRAIGLDLSFDEVRETQETCPSSTNQPPSVCVGNTRCLPFADGVFDVVICAEVLEHIRDYRVALGEIARVLKPGGRLAVSVPRFWPEWVCWKLQSGYHQVPGGHIRIFRPSALSRDIEARGFRHRHTHWAHGLHSPYWWLQCLKWECRESSACVRMYHRLLVWEIFNKPRILRLLSFLADPLMGKSVVLYFSKSLRSI